MTRLATRKQVHQGLARGEPVACRKWLARTCSPDYSQAGCCSCGIIRPDCATRKRVPLPRSLGVLQEYACGGLGRDVAQRTPTGASAASRRQLVKNPGWDGKTEATLVKMVLLIGFGSATGLTPTRTFSASQDPSAAVTVFLGRDTSPDRLLTCQPEYEHRHYGCQ